MWLLLRALPALLLVTAAPALAQSMYDDMPPLPSASAAPGASSPGTGGQASVGGGDTWDGLYFGGDLGGAMSNTTATVIPSGCFATGACGGGTSNNAQRTFFGSPNGGGFTAGGHVGYNFRISPALLIGIEADIAYDGASGTSSARSTLSAPLSGSETVRAAVSQDYLGTVRGRVGFIPSERWLLFATGGAAFGQTKSTTSVSFTAAGDTYAGSTSAASTGWVAGAGAEWAFSPYWSVKAEYLHVDLGSTSYSAPITNAAAVGAAGLSPAPSFQTRVTNAQNIAHLGLSYHFGVPSIALASASMPPAPPVVAAPAPPSPAAKTFIVFFDWDKDLVTREGAAVIQQAADAYKAGAHVQLQVTGYTDRSGSPGYNQRLSERRANNVAKALASLGVPREQMAVSGRGENDNRVPTAPGVREPQNRRVEIVWP